MKKQIISMMTLSLLLIGNALPVNVSHSKKSNSVSIQQNQKVKKNKTKRSMTIVDETNAITYTDEKVSTTNSDLNEFNNENKTSEVEEAQKVVKNDNSIKITESTPVKSNSTQKQTAQKEQSNQNQIQNRANEISSNNESAQSQQTNTNKKINENNQQEYISNIPTQKYYFAKCDCGYSTESHESVQDAINKLFLQGHGNSSEHVGYVAGGDLD